MCLHYPDNRGLIPTLWAVSIVENYTQAWNSFSIHHCLFLVSLMKSKISAIKAIQVFLLVWFEFFSQGN